MSVPLKATRLDSDLASLPKAKAAFIKPMLLLARRRCLKVLGGFMTEARWLSPWPSRLRLRRSFGLGMITTSARQVSGHRQALVFGYYDGRSCLPIPDAH